MTKSLRYLHVDQLRPHPFNTKVYGPPKPDADLLKSVAILGVLEPLVVMETATADQFVIISGHRRWAAEKTEFERRKPLLKTNSHALGDPMRPQTMRGMVPVRVEPLVVVRSIDGTQRKDTWHLCREDGLVAERLIIESNRQRVKTKGQVARETAELVRIEKALAAERMKAGKKADPRPSQTRGSKGKASEVVAKKTGQSKNTVEKQTHIVEQAEAGNPKATAALDKLDRNETSVAEAYREIQPDKPRKTPEQIEQRAAQEKTAQRLQAECRESGLTVEVAASKTPDRFHVAYHNVTKDEIQEVVGRRTPTASQKPTSEATPLASKPADMSVPLTTKDLMAWVDANNDANVNGFTITPRKKPLLGKVDLSFGALKPAIAKQLAEDYLRLKKESESA